MLHNISLNNPLVGQFIAELRGTDVQTDRMRFRRNLERIGEALAIEICRTLPTTTQNVATPLGTAQCTVLQQQPVIATILRAGLPLHQGLLNMLDKADNAFISAYRKHHKSGKFTIQIEYLSCPNLDHRILIVCDPMLATGASMALTIEQLLAEGQPTEIHVAAVIACTEGVREVHKHFPRAHIWVAALDEELTAKGYIVPGLGDAGDLAYGPKTQD